jgi:hypothetical protein
MPASSSPQWNTFSSERMRRFTWVSRTTAVMSELVGKTHGGAHLIHAERIDLRAVNITQGGRAAKAPQTNGQPIVVHAVEQTKFDGSGGIPRRRPKLKS